MAFLVVLPGLDVEQPEISRTDFSVVTLKFQKTGDTPFTLEDEKVCVQDSQHALSRLFAEIVRTGNIKIDVTYIGEGDGSFWVEFGIAVRLARRTLLMF